MQGVGWAGSCMRWLMAASVCKASPTPGRLSEDCNETTVYSHTEDAISFEEPLIYPFQQSSGP